MERITILEKLKGNRYLVESRASVLKLDEYYHIGYKMEGRTFGSRAIVLSIEETDGLHQKSIIKTKKEIQYIDTVIEFGTIFGSEGEENNLKEYLELLFKGESNSFVDREGKKVMDRAKLILKEEKRKKAINKLEVWFSRKSRGLKGVELSEIRADYQNKLAQL